MMSIKAADTSDLGERLLELAGLYGVLDGDETWNTIACPEAAAIIEGLASRGTSQEVQREREGQEVKLSDSYIVWDDVEECRVAGIADALLFQPRADRVILHATTRNVAASTVRGENGVLRWELAPAFPVTLRYWDADAERYVEHRGAERVRSTAGYGPGPEHRETWRLPNGRLVRLTRHADRGDLATDIEVE